MLLLVAVAATAGGLALQRLHVPGGLIFGAMVGAALVSATAREAVTIPGPVRAAAFLVVGASIGVGVTRDTVGALRPILLPALLSGALIIVAGLAIAYLLRVLGMAPPGDVLATSPGALSVVSALAAEQRVGAVEVAVFHLVRVVMVLLSLPAILHLLSDPAR